jgi:mRNA-degrading endonuclease RelE of RelBE toxin-antitoxin system
MTVNTRTEIVGAKEAIKALRKIDPELRKQFNRDAKQIVQPIIDDAKNRYPQQLLSGMTRKWTQRGNQKFPYDVRKAQRGLKFKADTSRRAGSVIRVTQTDPAAAIIEFAGKNPNPLGTQLDAFGRASRFLWPAAERQLPKVQAEMEKAVLDAVRKVAKEL